MENIKWIHWFWITILCVIDFQYYVVITHSLHSTDINGINNSFDLTIQNNSNYNASSIFLQVDEKVLNNTKDKIIIGRNKLALTQSPSENIEKSLVNASADNASTEINNNYNKLEYMNISVTETQNTNNSNKISNNATLTPKHNRADILDFNQNLNFNVNSNISYISTNLTSHFPVVQLETDSVNNTNLKEAISSERGTFDVKFIDKLTSKSVKSDTNLNSTNTTNDDPSVAEFQDNLTNLDNFINSKRRGKGLSSEYRSDNVKYINYSITGKNLLIRSAESTDSINKSNHDEPNVSSEALTYKSMDAGLISGICFATIALCCAVVSSVLILYRRRRYLNKPHALSEPDSGYIDDSIIRDTNSDELYSLDNDSFLNSLEAMTIQNYWSETVKHTKL